MLDLSKAFDTVTRNILPSKLGYYGVRRGELSLIESYVSDKLQMVKAGEQTCLLNVSRGSPQGSILGSFLFLVYINGLSRFIPAKYVLYADDTTILIPNKDRNAAVEAEKIALERSSVTNSLEKTGGGGEITFGLG